MTLLTLAAVAVAAFVLLRRNAQVAEAERGTAASHAPIAEPAPSIAPPLASLTSASSTAPVPSEAPSSATTNGKNKPAKPKSSDIPKDFDTPTF